MLRRSLAALALAAAVAHTATAATISPLAPSWSRGSSYTTYQAWDVFTAAAGPNAPNSPGAGPQVDAAPFNPNGPANAYDASGASLVIGSGNIYSSSGVQHVNVVVHDYNLGAGYVTTVLFQTRTQGTEADYSSLHLTYADATGTHVLSATSGQDVNRQPLGGFGGFLVDHASVFQIPASVGSWTLDFLAAGTSMSFDRATVDTITTRAGAANPLMAGMNPTVGFVAVPEPTSLAATALIGTLLLRRTRRR